MLNILRKKSKTQTIIEFPIDNVETNDQLDISAALQSALNAIENGEQIDASNLPDDIAAPILHLATAVKDRNEKALKRAVSLSVNASNSMAAAALITASIREIETNSSAMAAAIEQLDASISQISGTAQTSADKMNNANNLMSEGLNTVRDTNVAAQTTSDAMNSMQSQTKAVSDAVNQIGSFVSTIDEIAQQTNLLALNATIEAARAGDAGKGFAVVAAEVKTLSTATQKATEDINARIGSLQKDVEQLLQSFNNANTSVSNTQELSQKTEANIEEIANIVSETSEGMSIIASVLSEQTEATNELAQGVNKVADSSVETSSMADEVIEAVDGSQKVIDELFAALDGRNIHDYVLNRAKSDHYLWKKNVAEMLVGLNNLKQNELADHHSCRLGKWCDNVSDEGISNHSAFKLLDEPHKQVHDFGKLAAAEFAKGNIAASHKAFADMQEASVKVVDILDRLISR